MSVVLCAALSACEAAPELTPPDLADPGTCARGRPVETPPRASASVRLRNRSAADRYVMVVADYCDAFSISRGGRDVPLTMNLQYVCEGPGPRAGTVRLRRLRPGETTDLAWDGRELSTCTSRVDCARRGWVRPAEAPYEILGAWAPAAAGPYGIRVGVESSLPERGCQESAGDLWTCALPGRTQYDLRDRCPSGLSAAADFSLPMAGPVTVDVPVD